VAATKAKVAELSAGELALARRAHALVLAYDAALSRVYVLRAQVLAAEATAASLRAMHRSTTALLQREALLFYVGAVPNEAPSGGAAMAGEFISEADQATFERLAVGNLSRTLALFQQEETGIERALAGYRRALRAELAAARALVSSRLHALAQAAALQNVLERSRAELAAEAVKQRASAGPPVGHGVVAAIATELGAASATTAQGVGQFTRTTAPTHLSRSARPVVNAAQKAGPATQPKEMPPTSTTSSPSGQPSTAKRMPNLPAPTRGAGGSSRTAPAVVLAKTTLSTNAARRATPTSRAKTTSSLPATTPRAKTATAAPTNAPSTTTTTIAPAPTTTLAATTTTTLGSTTTSATTTAATVVTTTTSPAATSPAPAKTERPTAATTTTSDASSPSGEPSPASTSGPSTTSSPSTTSASGAATRPPPAGGVWLELRECESGDNYQADTGNGFYGAYQFAWSTWTELGYSGRPDQAPYWLQDEAAQKLEAMEGWAPWPACSAALGL